MNHVIEENNNIELEFIVETSNYIDPILSCNDLEDDINTSKEEVVVDTNSIVLLCSRLMHLNPNANKSFISNTKGVKLDLDDINTS